jgi:hypothetical protein
LLFCAFFPISQEALLSPVTLVIFGWFFMRASKQILRLVEEFLNPKKTKANLKALSSRNR